jgi:CBS domain-containing protein
MLMMNWERITVVSSASLGEVLTRMSEAGIQAALVIDEERHLLGVLSDGDVRSSRAKGWTYPQAK